MNGVTSVKSITKTTGLVLAGNRLAPTVERYNAKLDVSTSNNKMGNNMRSDDLCRTIFCTSIVYIVNAHYIVNQKQKPA